MAVETGQLLLRDISPELKQALMEAAEYAQSNMQAIAIAILAEEFNLDYRPRHARASSPSSDNLTMNLRLPEELHKAIRLRAAEEDIAHSDVAITVLCSRLGVELQPEYVNRRRGRVRAA